MSGERVPCIWIVASHRVLKNEHDYHQCYTVMDEVGTRTMRNMGMQPVCFPRVPEDRIETMLDMVDGVLLGGSATNVHPSLYGEPELAEEKCYDTERDRLVQPLIRLAVARRVPVIAFCRGSHDFNVAMGGSLYQSLQKLDGAVRHWEDPDESLDAQYSERHPVTVLPGGKLEKITGMQRFPVSSLHSQGVKELGHGLVAEAFADDGLVEAFRWHDESQFAWAFQFHPEWNWKIHPPYLRIMNAYADGCWERLRSRGAPTGSSAQLPQSRPLAHSA